MTAIGVLALTKRKVDNLTSGELTGVPGSIVETAREFYEIHCGECMNTPVALMSLSPSPTGLRIDYFCSYCLTDGCVDVPLSTILGLPPITQVH
jgi:hypothetical protein